MHHAHEAPWVMIAPLLLLATGAVVAGRLGFNLFVGDGREDFWRDSILVLPAHDTIEGAHHAPIFISYLPLVMGLLGIATAWYMYIRETGLPAQVAQTFRPIYIFLLNKWYFDELYDFLFVRPAFWLGRSLWKKGDGTVIDGFGPDGVSEATIDFSVIVSRLQTGYLYHYAFAMLIGVVVLVSWYYLLPLVW
jgi:NADH-quinone oxidoreductase subunit L